MFNRNIPQNIAQNVVSTMSDVGWIQIRQEGHYELSNVSKLPEINQRLLFAIVKAAHGILCIDSSVMHIAAAFNKKAVVLWGATRPVCLGYSCHTNIVRYACNTPLCNRPNSFISDTNADGGVWECPYSTNCLKHDEQNIIDKMEEAYNV